METDAIIKKCKIKSIKIVKNEDVYDLTVKKNHNFFANNILVHNCGELPLQKYGSCILMLLNLPSFVEGGKFDYRKFDEECRLASRLIDDMVDLEVEKIEGIIAKVKSDPEPKSVKAKELEMWQSVLETCRSGRRVGLGITGLGDCLAALGIKYDSDEALKKVDKVFSAFHASIMDEQATLSKERGQFGVWSWEKEKDCHYIKLLPQETQDRIRKHGRRNISVSTCSPAGSMSILTGTSSGIEPVFMRKYNRRKKLTPDEKARGVKANHVDNDGIEWVSFDVLHPGLARWLKANPGKTEKDSPYWGCQADELGWEKRVRLQAAMQKYITHSISSTCNLPATATEDELDRIYMTAWRSGCKGITVYRDGCRDGVMKKDAASEEQPSTITQNPAPPRPNVLECDIHHSSIGKDNWVFFVGKLSGQPYEIFGGKKKNVDIPRKYKTGWIAKNGKDAHGRRTYDLVLGSLTDPDEKTIVKDIASEFTPDTGSYTRLVSTMLRHGVPVKFICEQLHKDNEASMFTLEKIISRILKRAIKDGEQASGACEKCSGKLQYKDGCVSCPSCGWSKCN